MSEIVIDVDNLSKRYLVGHRSSRKESYTALRDVIARKARNFARKSLDAIRGNQVVEGDEVEEFWALQGVSFAVKRGEVLGIVGRNGAGKTTLLRLLSRITEPTAGRITLRGRIASLLEVGTGFHPELSGRENIYLNGAILGMQRREVARKFDEIVSFAEVERFLDTPVKRYSSGMYVRLAFAVAAHLEPDVLIVDEVLAVGDAEFQKKCLGKMEDVSRREGRTVIFVSHNIGLINALCSTAIWLDKGTVRQQGEVRQIIDSYVATAVVGNIKSIDLESCARPPNLNGDRVRLKSLEWLSGIPLKCGDRISARIIFEARCAISQFSIGIGFSSVEGARILTYTNDHHGQEKCFVDVPCAGKFTAQIEMDALPLQMQEYDVNVFCRSGYSSSLLDEIRNACRVEVVSGSNTHPSIVNRFATARLPSKWSIMP
jgi:ABC-type polysaccharide/polyol phosphate transport system ATPase subunit